MSLIMPNVRIIGRLDIKGPNLIKGIHLEGLRVVGDPHEHAVRYYHDGIDELILIDVVASLYGRNNLRQVVTQTARDVFIPITVGGGIRSVDDARELLRSGADKVAVNTAAVRRPQLITEISRAFGSQCMVLYIEAKKKPGGGWEALTDYGREHSNLDVVDWARKACDLGAGEILLTSVDREGTRKGFDIELAKAVAPVAPVPVIVSGGLGAIDHLVQVIVEGKADAVALASVLHYNFLTLPVIRDGMAAADISVRSLSNYSGPLHGTV